mgnify:CR=1 FL=1
MDRKLILESLLKSADDFKVNTLYWDHDVLTPEENDLRNYPAPWIKKTIEFLHLINAKTIVEIGSTRMELTRNCVHYYDNCESLTPKDAPPCCQDGHSTYFWAREGFTTYTVDIDPHCTQTLESQYTHHLNESIPENLKICIPEDGVGFLQNFPEQIDFLFLDGWDKGTENYAENHLAAFIAAEDKLSQNHLISIDDTDFNTPSGGKDKLLTPCLIERGYIRLLWGRQILFFKYNG